MLNNLFLFAGEHYYLVAGFIVLVGLFIYNESLRGGGQVSPQQLSNLINTENALVIDLRSPDDFNRGHIHGSENVPNDQLDSDIGRLEKIEGRPIVLACELGSQSTAAGRKLMAKNIKSVYRLKGGLDAWKANHFPLVKS